MSEETDRTRIYAVLALIVLVGAFLRIYGLGAESIWLDEAASIHSAHKGIIPLLEDCATWHRHPPLHFFMLYVWIRVLGDSEVAVRSLSVVFGTASIVVLYFVGRHLFSSRIGLLGSLLLAVSPFAISFSQEARSYSLLLFLTLTSFLFFIKITSGDGVRKWHFWAFSLTNILLAYTHYFGLLVIASQIFYFLFLLFRKRFREVRRPFLYAQLATGIAYLPWAVIFVAYSIPRSWSWEQPTLGTLLDTVGEYSGHEDGRGVLLPIFICLGLLGLFSAMRLSERPCVRGPLQAVTRLRSTVTVEHTAVLLLVWFLFPIAIPFLISQVPLEQAGIYSIRYTISALPAFYLLVVKGADYLAARRLLRPVLVLLTLAIAWFLIAGLHDYYTTPQKGEWREATALVEAGSQEDDAIVRSHFALPFDYYYDGPAERFALDEDNEAEVAAAVLAAGKERMWLIESSFDGTSSRDYFVGTYGDEALVREERFHRVTVYLFDLNPD